MLIGEYLYNLDDKGRLNIPAKFRDDLENSVIVTKGLDKSLYIYSKSEWLIFEAKLKLLPMTNENARSFTRFFFSGATECEIDKQGRINVPLTLRTYASLEKEVYIIGVSNRVEIWNKENWQQYLSKENMDIENIAIQMSNLGI